MFIEPHQAPDTNSQSTDGDTIEIAQAATPAGEPIGQISAFQGTAFITHPDGTKVQAADGTPIFQGDAIETGAGGAIGITFADDSTFSLAENGSMVIDEMVYDPGTQAGKSAVSVAEGVFTFVSGQIAKTGIEAMTITTPVAVIGIRGTAGGGKAGPEGTPNTFTMFQDPGGGAGEMVIKTLGGTQVMNTPFQTTQISSRYVPPTQPVILPAAAVAQFYSKAAAVAPKAIPIGPVDQGPADQGPAEDTPGAEQADKAAQDAFEQVLAEGGDLDAAMAAAQGAATEASLIAVLAADPNAFGSAGSGASIINRIVDNVLLGVTGQIDHMGAGDGKGAGHGDFTDNFFGDGVDHFLGGDLDDLVGGFFDDFFFHGDDFGEGEDDFFDEFFDDPFDLFSKDVFEEAFDFDFEEFLFDVFIPLEFTDGVLGFNEDPFFLEEGETAFITTSTFDDFISNFTTGSDSRIGGTGNTRFTMIQGSTLGGTDSIDGGFGTDELALENLSNMAVVFDALTNVVSYSNIGGSVSGSVSLTSVEQIFADDGLDARVRFPTNLADDDAGFFGYILVGSGSNDTLNLADGTSLASTYGGLSGVTGETLAGSGATRTFGSLIFGGTGDDTITGTSGGDIIFGGDGFDFIDGGPASTVDGDILVGGDDADTFIFSNPGFFFGSVSGGELLGFDDSTSDTMEFTTSGSYNFTQLIIEGIETLDFTATGVTLDAVNTFFQSLSGNVFAAGGGTLNGQGGLDLSGLTNNDANISTLGLNTTFVGPGGTIIDFNDSIGRTILGSTGGDTLVGGGGGDDIDLGVDSSQDLVFYTSQSDTAQIAGSSVIGFDVITNFDRNDGDRIVFTQDGNFADFDDVPLSSGGDPYIFGNFATNGADLTSVDVVFISTAAGLVTGGTNLSDARDAIGTVTTASATASAPENDAIFVVNDGSNSGIFLYIAQNTDNIVDANELTLLATVDTVLQIGDLTTTDTLPP